MPPLSTGVFFHAGEISLENGAEDDINELIVKIFEDHRAFLATK